MTAKQRSHISFSETLQMHFYTQQQADIDDVFR